MSCVPFSFPGIDPTGEWAVLGGLALGGLIGYAIGGWDGAAAGAGLGGGAVAVALFGAPAVFVAGVAVGPWLVAGGGLLLAGALYRSRANNWGFKQTNAPKKVAVITGDLGPAVQIQMIVENISIGGFISNAESAGHDVDPFGKLSEREFIAVLNEYDAVAIVAHGAGVLVQTAGVGNRFYDGNGDPYAAIALGGVMAEPPTHKGQPFGQLTKTWGPEYVSANEIDGQVNNPDLILAFAGCQVGRTNRFMNATGIDPLQGGHFAAYDGDLNPSGIEEILNYVRDYLNDGAAVAGQNFNALGGRYVLDPNNPQFNN